MDNSLQKTQNSLTEPAAITLRDVQKSYKTFSLNIPNLEIKQGYITGLIGQNGAGKTTLLHSILNLISFEGHIAVLGSTMQDPAVRQKVMLVPETPMYLPLCNVKQVHDSIAPFYENWSEEIYQNLMTEFEVPNNKIKNLSKGQAKILSLIVAVSAQPTLLILDEPTANLDPVVRHRLLQILRDFVMDEEHSVLFSTHITSDLEYVCDYLVGMKKGGLIFGGEKDATLESYAVVQGKSELLDALTKPALMGFELSGEIFTGLGVSAIVHEVFGSECKYRKPTIEELLLYSVLGVK